MIHEALESRQVGTSDNLRPRLVRQPGVGRVREGILKGDTSRQQEAPFTVIYPTPGPTAKYEWPLRQLKPQTLILQGLYPRPTINKSNCWWQIITDLRSLMQLVAQIILWLKETIELMVETYSDLRRHTLIWRGLLWLDGIYSDLIRHTLIWRDLFWFKETYSDLWKLTLIWGDFLWLEDTYSDLKILTLIWRLTLIWGNLLLWL